MVVATAVAADITTDLAGSERLPKLVGEDACATVHRGTSPDSTNPGSVVSSPMKRSQPRLGTPNRAHQSEQLDSSNASVRSKRNGPQMIRRAIEADIESKARKKRSREVPASAGFKRS